MSLWSRIQRQLGEIAGDLVGDDTRYELEAARELLSTDPAAAIPIAERILHTRADHPLALALIGAANLELGNPRAAADAFERALASDDTLPEALLGRGEAALASARPEDAVTPYHRAVEEAGGDQRILAEAYRGLGVAYLGLGQLDKGIRELRKAVAEDAEDPVARSFLGDALVRRGGLEEARRHLRRAIDRAEPPAIALVAQGRLALEEGSPEAAATLFEAALARARQSRGGAFEIRIAPIQVGLGDAARARGDLHAAREHYQIALDDSARTPADVLARLAEVFAEMQDYDKALELYRHSLEIEESEAVLASAVSAAIHGGSEALRVELANRLLAHAPDHPGAMVARALVLAEQGEREAARGILRATARGDGEAVAHRALAELELADGRLGTAAEHALAALRREPRNQRTRDLLARIREAELEVQVGLHDPKHVTEDDDAVLYQLALELAALLGTRAELAPLAAEPAQAAADFDRPLLVTVMGEFSSGKSSFVNAFIGEDIAPTGITPTTATINIVKYGRDRGGRLIHQDGRTESLGWSELGTRLRQLSGRAAAQIAQVEILLPLEALERVHIVDTPGLNSILPEHETVARDFIRRADAVVWVFSAAQAGKKSERLALERIAEEGKRVLGVLNKVDQLDAGQVEEVRAHVASELDDIVDIVVPVSARRAMEAKAQGKEVGGEFETLEHELEGRFFAQARQLKRLALDRRLGDVLRRARERLEAARRGGGTHSDELRQAAERVRVELDQFLEATVDRERATMRTEVVALFRQAAQEVLELVRPRRLPFGSNQATPADRDYLIGLLEAGYDAVIGAAEERVAAELEAIANRARATLAVGTIGAIGDPSGDVERAALDATRWVRAQVFGRTGSYVRGYLRGGYVADFFRRDLPKIELDEDTVYQALYQSSPDLDAVIAVPLARAGAEALAALADRLEHLADVQDLHGFDLDVGIVRALETVDERRRALHGSDAGEQVDTGNR